MPVRIPPLETLRRFGAGLLDLVLPRACLGCRKPLRERPAPLLLCTRCRGRLEPVDAARSCPGCLRPLAASRGSASYCGACRQTPPAYDFVRAIWRYRPPLDGVLRAFKFGGLDFLGAALAAAAAARFGSELAGELDRVVPVPLPWTRRLVRGFNQAERIAHPLARRLGVELVAALARAGRPGIQSGLGRAARQSNVHGSFRVTRPQQVAGARVLLVDDILTTGATARAAASELRRAGALKVVVLVAAWTPPEPAPSRLDSPCTRP